MKILTKKPQILTAVFALTLLSLNEGNASTLKINNHSQNNVEVKLTPEPAETCKDVCWSCLGGTVESNSSMVRTITLSPEKLQTGQRFAVRGTEGGFMTTGECRNLNVQNNYEISFFETDLGIRCECKSL